MFPSYDERHCRDFKWGRFDATAKAILLTFAIVILTLVIESVANIKCKEFCGFGLPQAGGGEQSGDTASQRPTHELSINPRGGLLKKFWVPGPALSATTRKDRFVGATALMIPLIIAFGVRMHDQSDQGPWECHGDTEQPPWAVAIIFNILPFTCACFAWLRSLVDCILLRWNTSLAYRRWPMFLPPAFIVGLGLLPIRSAASCLTGSRGYTLPEREDVEMNGRQNEEIRPLVDDIGPSERGDDEITAYSPRSSAELKEHE